MPGSLAPHILIVDDEALNRGLIALQLKRLSYRVTEASGGIEALKLLGSENVELVLLDIDMPGMNGLEVLDAIRQRHTALALPVIMATAEANDRMLIDALLRGANDYLVKPLNMQIAAARIRTQLSMRKLARMKEEFIDFASHDLKKPLMLEEDVLSQLKQALPPDANNAGEMVNILIASNRNMQNVVRGFLDATVRRDWVGEVSMVDLCDLVAKVVASNTEYAQRKQIALRSDQGSEPIALNADAFLLRQIVENLVGNALKFSPPNTQTTVRIKPGPGIVSIEVSDQGPGVRDADLPRLFQKGVKLGNKPTGNEESTGIGLALCKELTQQLGGEIGVRNNAGPGATFWLRLPRR